MAALGWGFGLEAPERVYKAMTRAVTRAYTRKTLPPLPPASLEHQNEHLQAQMAAPMFGSPEPLWPTTTTQAGASSEDLARPNLDVPAGRVRPFSRPPRPVSKDPPRLLTTSTKRLSLASIFSRRSIKYGTGKHAGVELVPQPSDDPDDPLVRDPVRGAPPFFVFSRHPSCRWSGETWD